MGKETETVCLSEEAVKNITASLGCQADDIEKIEQMKVGLTNASYAFSVHGKKYVYREPGTGTELFINRACEAYAEEAAKRLGLDTTIIAIDQKTGWKLSTFVEDASYIDPTVPEDREAAMKLLRVLHDSKTPCSFLFDYAKEANKLLNILKKQQYLLGDRLKETKKIQKRVDWLAEQMDREGFERVLTHNDAWSWNMLKGKDGKITLIDWEYAGCSYPQSDVAYFTSNLEWTDEEYRDLIEVYEGRAVNERELAFYFANLCVVMWYWYVWAIFEESTGTEVSDIELWYRKAIHALEVSEAHYRQQYVYMLQCGDGSFYTGWTNDLKKRVETHQKGQGAKYTKTHQPVKLAYFETFETKSEAMKREYALKQLSHKEKEALIAGFKAEKLLGE